MMVTSDPVRMTVAVPMFRAGASAWLALESLCLQTDVPVAWELLVVEEQDSLMLGKDALMEYYSDRLDAAGCKSIEYIALDEWVPLSDKWTMMGQMASEDSEVFVLCGADDWNGSHRLHDAYYIISEFGADWAQYMKGYYYDILIDQTILFDGTNYFRGMINPMLGKSIATKWMRDLPRKQSASHIVDTWLMLNLLEQHPAAIYTIINSDDWKNNVYTYGANAISARHDELTHYTHPFYETDVNLDEIIPKGYLGRFRSLPQYQDSERIAGGWKPNGSD